MEKYNTLINKKDFNLFINNLSEYDLRIKNILKKEEVTYEEDEIKLVSRYFLELNENGSFNIEEKKTFIAYLGEAFMKIHGGEWDFTGLKSDSFAINEPVITKYKNEGIRMSPSETIFKVFEDKNEDYFNWSIKYMEEFQKKVDDVFAYLFPKKNNLKIKNKKDLLLFIDNSDLYITYLINKLNKKGLVGASFDDYIDKIDAIEKYYEDDFLNETIDEQQKLRFAFWSFFAKLLIRELGGELQIAPKNDYSEGTPQLINYGNRFDKKGKRKWIGISFNSWLESHISKKNLVLLKGKVNKLIEDYS